MAAKSMEAMRQLIRQATIDAETERQMEDDLETAQDHEKDGQEEETEDGGRDGYARDATEWYFKLGRWLHKIAEGGDDPISRWNLKYHDNLVSAVTKFIRMLRSVRTIVDTEWAEELPVASNDPSSASTDVRCGPAEAAMRLRVDAMLKISEDEWMQLPPGCHGKQRPLHFDPVRINAPKNAPAMRTCVKCRVAIWNRGWVCAAAIDNASIVALNATDHHLCCYCYVNGQRCCDKNNMVMLEHIPMKEIINSFNSGVDALNKLLPEYYRQIYERNPNKNDVVTRLKKFIKSGPAGLIDPSTGLSRYSWLTSDPWTRKKRSAVTISYFLKKRDLQHFESKPCAECQQVTAASSIVACTALRHMLESEERGKNRHIICFECIRSRYNSLPADVLGKRNWTCHACVEQRERAGGNELRQKITSTSKHLFPDAQVSSQTVLVEASKPAVLTIIKPPKSNIGDHRSTPMDVDEEAENSNIVTPNESPSKNIESARRTASDQNIVEEDDQDVVTKETSAARASSSSSSRRKTPIDDSDVRIRSATVKENEVVQEEAAVAAGRTGSSSPPTRTRASRNKRRKFDESQASDMEEEASSIISLNTRRRNTPTPTPTVSSHSLAAATVAPPAPLSSYTHAPQVDPNVVLAAQAMPSGTVHVDMPPPPPRRGPGRPARRGAASNQVAIPSESTPQIAAASHAQSSANQFAYHHIQQTLGNARSTDDSSLMDVSLGSWILQLQQRVVELNDRCASLEKENQVLRDAKISTSHEALSQEVVQLRLELTSSRDEIARLNEKLSASTLLKQEAANVIVPNLKKIAKAIVSQANQLVSAIPEETTVMNGNEVGPKN